MWWHLGWQCHWASRTTAHWNLKVRHIKLVELFLTSVIKFKELPMISCHYHACRDKWHLEVFLVWETGSYGTAINMPQAECGCTVKISALTQRSSHLRGSCLEIHFLACRWFLILYVADITGQVSPYPDSTSYMMKLTFAILGPVMALGLLGALVLFLMRRTHRKRLMSARNMTDLETYYASDDLRVTAAGDSTLRVVECLWLIIC